MMEVTQKLFLLFWLSLVRSEPGLQDHFGLEEPIMDSKRQDVPIYEVTLSLDHPVEYISSPGFPYKSYPQDIQMIYYIKTLLDDEVTRLSTRILITFEMFALEESEYCHKDGLEFVDASNQVRAYCGAQVGRTILSESSHLTVRFFTDKESEARGFSIRLEMYNTGCSSTFSGVQTGSFASPNFPNRYYSDDLCVWKIVAPEGKMVRVKFDNLFDIRAYEPYCVQDYLAASVQGDLDKEVKRFCQSMKPGVVDSRGNSIIFLFRTDCCFEGKGFRATFAVLDAVDTTTTGPPPPPEICPCGQENKEMERIVGGEEVKPPNRYPWVVGLINSKNELFCGGALINPFYVLTASHCVERETASSIKLLLGGHHVASSPSPVLVSEIIMYPTYSNRTYINDIAIIKMKEQVDFSKEVSPVCLAAPEVTTEGDVATIAGWGYGQEGGVESQTLQEVEVSVVSNANCVAKYGGIILDTNLCAGEEEGKDACQGDSGGTLFVKKDQAEWYAVGIASWGIGCARKNYPGVYTRISEYYKWIKDHTSDAPSCVSPPIEPNLEDCGIPNTKPSARIVGGSETQPFEYPWMAAIVYNKTIAGAGALISRYYVLTAASVFDSWMEWYPDVLDVFLGEHDLTKKEPFTQRFRVQSVLHHYAYGRPTPYNNDLCLLKLEVPPTGLPHHFRPICLPRTTVWYPEGSAVTVAGWGRTSTNGPGSTVLLEVDLNIVDQTDCMDIYPAWITDKMICATASGKDTCKGDSGAPAMNKIDGRYYLVGVSSWASNKGCAIPGSPRVFAAIYSNLQWLSEKTGLTVS